MKKKILKTLGVLAVGIFLFFSSSSQILAVCVDGDRSGVCGECSPITQCDTCYWCIETQQEAQEDLTGKVYNPALPQDLRDTSGPAFLQKILQLGISLALVIGAIIFFFMLLVGGISWISGGGDKAKLESAQKKITHALIGLAILLSTFAIIKLVGYLFGIDLLKITLPTL